MSASLVGSEMCIRDRRGDEYFATPGHCVCSGPRLRAPGLAPRDVVPVPVSYTHLTLPTICSV
eukprot:6988106-Alexandrium_andersonii.AAC.1